MNIDDANRIPLDQILEKLTSCLGKPSGHELVYSSPLREEKTPSFYVNPKKNLWYDHGEGIGGDVVKLICHHLERSGEEDTVSDALRWLGNMMGQHKFIAPVRLRTVPLPQENKLSLVHTSKLQHPALIKYLQERAVSEKLAKLYLKEAWIYNRETRKHFFALAFQNEHGGHEIRNRFLKISLGKKGLTFVRGTVPKPEGIHFFEGVMDFLSALTHYKIERFPDDAIVFNSLSLMAEATPLIRGYGYREVRTWMDNDNAGTKATNALAAFFQTEKGLRHIPMNETYQPHKDVNAWLTSPAKLTVA